MNKQVLFSVTQNNGMLSVNGGTPAASVLATTDANGNASVNWTLGMRAGAGSDAVQAYSVGYSGTALFTASANLGTPGLIVVDTGNNQTGAVNQSLPKPLIAVVIDAGNNRLPNVPVTFTVVNGGGSFAGQPSTTVTTDSDGRAAATLTLGFQEGNSNNLVTATFPGNTAFPASFAASGLGPGNPNATVISGVVLDNSNIPIAGATVRALVDTTLYSSPTSAQTAASVQTDATGHFSIYKAPAGYVKLFVDGSTSSTLGPFPILEYDMVTVAGQVNTVNRSIYLIALKTSNQLCVTDTTGGGTLTIPDAPGFSLTFGPGQVTFPGGSKTGCVSVTQVHPDKVPMEPAFGQQPRFIVTIQPAGAVFSPPAPITIPNVDGLQPRQVTEMYSYDHDISSFVAIGTGMVSDDGQVIRSNPGVGVLKAGWHCGGNPQAGGTVADCPPCTYCQGSSANSVSCIPDPSQVGKACSSPLNNCYSGGTCGFTVVGGNGGQPTQIPIGVCVGGVPLTGTSCNAGGSVPAVCINGQCTGSGSQCNCNSPDPCTIAQCVNGTCSLTPNPQCQSCSGQASGTSPCGPCVDGGTCTNGSCVGGNPKLITNPTIQADGKTADTTGLNQSVVFSVQGLFQNCSTISIIVDFGDGSTPQAAAPSTFATSGVFSAQIQHSYGSTGTFTATATVQCDMCSFSYTTQVTVHVMQLGIVVLFDGGSFDGATVGLGSLASAIQQTFGNAVIQTEIGPGASLASQEGPASFFVASQLAAHPGARVILIGFSLGGDTAVLASINSYLRIALDPISRNLALGSFPVYDQSGTSFFSGPSNLTIDYHQHNTAASIGSCGIPLEGYTVTGSTNVDISYLGYGHCGLPGHTDIQNLIVSQISAALSAP